MGNVDWGRLFGMALQTVPEPRVVARDVFAFGAPRSALWQILGLILVVTTVLAVIVSALFPVDPEAVREILGSDDATPVLIDPLTTGIIQAVMAFLTIWAIYGIGRMFGGTGSFDQAILTVIWLHFVLFLLQAAAMVLGVFAPGLASLLMLAAFVMTFWILSHFVAEMHGFRSAGSVFASILMVFLVLALVLSFLIAITGLGGDLVPVTGGA